MVVEAMDASAAGGWLAAWRGRRDNPLALAAPWGAGRGEFMLLPPAVWALWAICSALATALVFQSYRRFQTLAPNASISRAYALNTLVWGVVTLLDYALPVAACWLLMRIYRAYRACCGFLSPLPGRAARFTPELAACPLSDAAVVYGAGLYTLREIRAPLLLLALVSAADQLAGVCASHQGLLLAPGNAAWPVAPWLWALGGAVLIAGVKALSGALVIVAGAWALLCFSAYWRHPALPGVALSLAMLYHVLSLGLGWPGRNLYALYGCDWVAEVFHPLLSALMLGVGLILLATEAQVCYGPRAWAWLARTGLIAWRMAVACALLVALLWWAGRYIDYDTLLMGFYDAKSGWPELRAQAPVWLWPLHAFSACPPFTALEQVFQLPEARAAMLGRALAMRAGLLLGLALLLGAFGAGHARMAVWIARRGAQ
jgi:hypothetical protein